MRTVSDFNKYVFNNGLCSDTFEPVSFKLGIVLGTAMLFSLTSVRMASCCTRGHRVMRKLGHCAIVLALDDKK